MADGQRHDEQWFDEAYRAFYPSLVRYGYRRLADVDAAKELAQEAFVVAWRRRDEVPAHPLPWLYGVARKLLANEWRARRRRPEPVGFVELADNAFPDSLEDSVAAVVDLRRALATLSDDDQEILRLVGWERLKIAEVAAVLSCSRLAASARLMRARRRLSAALKQRRDNHAEPEPVRRMTVRKVASDA
ncbi:RNA polymerase sigma factor [Micromonospora sp. NBC_01813]|uniref:RNA polymerase sigma factor n=1 Tax=Micromonospora sp. NBC_01813 TaxID=2975988 RepID=UPI002DDC2F9A|nr:RNA polymerase sigma factor [Micromonospora sp. NBC_01813]WSA07366.1 RNA polymerase sigma factor [Micromonospora sp. NBC_01813]